MTDHPSVPQPRMAEDEADRRLSSGAADFGIFMAKADSRFHASDHKAAAAFYRAAAQYAQQNGTTSAGMARDVQRAKAMGVWFDGLFRDHLLTALDAAGLTRSNRHPRFQKSLEIMLGQRARSPETAQFPQTPLVYYYPEMPYVQFANAQDFGWREAIEAEYTAMREEAMALLAGQAHFRPYIKTNRQRPQGDVHMMLENADWSTYFLWENGAAVTAHVAQCPKTFTAVTNIVPLCHIGPRAPSVMLSLLRPGAHIPPHTGMINCRYICHLPLVVPDNCGLRVGEKTIAWNEGQLIAFDDSVQHEAWNRSGENRVVLIFDIWRPELGAEERKMVTALFAAVDSY